MRQRRAARRSVALCVLVTLILVAAPVRAGSEIDPEVDDHPDFSDGRIDLLAAWFEPALGGTRLTIKMAAANSPPVNHVYYAYFELDGQAHVAALGIDDDSDVRSIFFAPDLGSITSIRSPADFRDDMTGMSFKAGEPAYITGVIPWGVVPGVEPGNTFDDLAAGTAIVQDGDWDDLDSREASRDYTLTRLPPSAVVSKYAGAFGLALAAATAGALGAFYYQRRRGPRAPAASPGAIAVPVARDEPTRAQAGARDDVAQPDPRAAADPAPAPAARPRLRGGRFGLRPPE